MASYNTEHYLINLNDRVSILNLLRTFVFGGKTVELYDETKIYNAGDKAYIQTSVYGDFDIITAKSDGVTGEYNAEDWDYFDMDTVASSSMNMIQISPTKPTDNGVGLWIAPVAYGSHILPEPVYPTSL